MHSIVYCWVVKQYTILTGNGKFGAGRKMSRRCGCLVGTYWARVIADAGWILRWMWYGMVYTTKRNQNHNKDPKKTSS